MSVLSIKSACGHTILPESIKFPERVMVPLTAGALQTLADALISAPGEEFTPAQSTVWDALDASHRALTGKAIYA